MIRCIVVFVFLSFISLANAQVYRCTDPVTGKILLTDEICPSSSHSKKLQDKPSAEQIRQENERAKQAILESEAQHKQVQDVFDKIPEDIVENSGAVDLTRSQACYFAHQRVKQAAKSEIKYTKDQVPELKRRADIACLGNDGYVQLQKDRYIAKQLSKDGNYSNFEHPHPHRHRHRHHSNFIADKTIIRRKKVLTPPVVPKAKKAEASLISPSFKNGQKPKNNLSGLLLHGTKQLEPYQQ